METTEFKNQLLNEANIKAIQKYGLRYNSFVKSKDYDELYKWEAVKVFQDNWNVEAENFGKMFERSFVMNNLVSGYKYYPIKMMKEFIAQDSEAVRKMFRNLYNEELDVSKRAAQFEDDSRSLIKKFNSSTNNEFNHMQGDRSISIYLFYRFPEKYYLYKYKMYRDFCKRIGIQSPTMGDDNNLVDYFTLCDQVKILLNKNPELFKNHPYLLNPKHFKDTSGNLITQDFLYFVSKIFDDKSAEGITSKEVTEPIPEYVPSVNLPLNTILFGPPGTGKTYSTKEYALRAIEELSESDFTKKYEGDRDIINKQFAFYKERNQIEFVTFHQSFSYEDFIEGIKPKMQNNYLLEDTSVNRTSADVEYEIQDGVFKLISETARSYQSFLKQNKTDLWRRRLTKDELTEKKFFKMSLGNSQIEEGEQIYKYCIENNCIAIGFGDDIDFTKSNSRLEIADKFKKEGVELKGKQDFQVFAIERFKLWMRKGDIVIVSYGNLLVRAIGVIIGDYEFKENTKIPFDHFRKVEWLLVDQEIPVNEIYEKVFSQQTIYEMWDNKIKQEFFIDNSEDKSSNEKRNHVLIIDEINRGNIANIFGELITLIEEDKREGRRECISTKLPYSKKSFTVPSNLYIIGTMNTADRSIESLDTALRRRFSFSEMQPDSDALLDEDNKGMAGEVNLMKLLDVINERIEKLIDKDHKIGHSYFINVRNYDDLVSVFNDKIIPLLEEYFFGDYGKIGLVLGESFIEYKAKSNSTFAKFKYDESLLHDLNNKKVYVIREKNAWNFKSIYQLDLPDDQKN